MLTGGGQLPVLDGFALTLLRFALTLAVQVDIRIREDAVQPCLQVRALGELVVGREGLHIGFLHQVLSVGGVAAHAQGRAVELVYVLHGLCGKAFA